MCWLTASASPVVNTPNYSAILNFWGGWEKFPAPVRHVVTMLCRTGPIWNPIRVFNVKKSGEGGAGRGEGEGGGRGGEERSEVSCLRGKCKVVQSIFIFCQQTISDSMIKHTFSPAFPIYIYIYIYIYIERERERRFLCYTSFNSLPDTFKLPATRHPWLICTGEICRFTIGDASLSLSRQKRIVELISTVGKTAAYKVSSRWSEMNTFV